MSQKEQGPRRNLFHLLMHIPVPWVFVISYLAGASMEYGYPSHTGAEQLLAVRVLGVVLLAVGLGIAARCLLIFHKARTTTVPGRTSAMLITWGPYRFSRNPMYVSLTLAYLGEAGILKQAWPLLFLPLTIVYLNWIVIPVEEARLTEAFAEDYQRYRVKVRRWI